MPPPSLKVFAPPRRARFYVALSVLLVHGLVAGAATYYVATNGVDTNAGTSNAPFATVMRAQTAASSGSTVYLRGGTYYLDNSHLTTTNSAWAIVNNLNKSGVSYVAFPGERPVFDFSSVVPTGWRVTAFYVTASDCTFKGFDVVGVTINLTTGNVQSECFRVTGSRNRFEQLAMHDGMGIGWYLTSGSSNLVLNCDAYKNSGLNSSSIGNIDGFGCHPNSASGSGNVFRGCRSWFNSDDGYDCINAFAAVTFENCWAFYNGYTNSTFTSSGGDANGFKAGGYGVSGTAFPATIPRHTVRFCLSVRNRANGFYANHHLGGGDWFNNTAYRNGGNFNMLCSTNNSSGTNDVPGYDHVMHNNVGYKGSSEVTHLGTSNDTTFNYFTLAVTVASNDFVSLDESFLTMSRQADGSLPNIPFARLTNNSDLLDAGTNINYPFYAAAPDLGAFEAGPTNGPSLAVSSLDTNAFLTGSGWANVTNILLASTNLTLPATQWTRLGTNRTDLLGYSYFTNAMPANLAQRFYRLTVP